MTDHRPSLMTPLEIYNILDHARFSEWWSKKHPAVALKMWPGIGAIKIRGSEFDFASGGQDAAILPVLEGDDVVDLAAWTHTAPAKVYLYTGCGIDLNLYDLRRATLYQIPFAVHGSPIEWLIAGCAGGCPLSTQAWPEYQALPTITTSTPEMNRRVRDEIGKLCKMPKIEGGIS